MVDVCITNYPVLFEGSNRDFIWTYSTILGAKLAVLFQAIPTPQKVSRRAHKDISKRSSRRNVSCISSFGLMNCAYLKLRSKCTLFSHLPTLKIQASYKTLTNNDAALMSIGFSLVLS